MGVYKKIKKTLNKIIGGNNEASAKETQPYRTYKQIIDYLFAVGKQKEEGIKAQKESILELGKEKECSSYECKEEPIEEPIEEPTEERPEEPTEERPEEPIEEQIEEQTEEKDTKLIKKDGILVI